MESTHNRTSFWSSQPNLDLVGTHSVFLLSPFELAPSRDLVGNHLAFLLSPFRTDPLFSSSISPFHSLHGFIPLEPVVTHQGTQLVDKLVLW